MLKKQRENEASRVDYEPGVLRVFQSKDETRSFYNKIAGVYDLLAERSEQPMRERGLQLLAAQPGERVLEIGFGTGHCLVQLARRVGPKGSVFGVDISDNMVIRTHKLLHRKHLSERVRLQCADAEQLLFRPNSFDAIFTSFTLELFDTPDLGPVLAEWKRVLKVGGRLVVVAVSKEGRPGLVLRTYEWSHRHFPNLVDCRPIYVRRALEAAGFRIAEAQVDQMWVPVEIVLGFTDSDASE